MMNNILSSPIRFGQSAAQFYRYAVLDSLLIVKRHGFRELLRQRGRRFVLGVVAYYFVRDSLIYIVIPFCVARGIF